MVTIDEIIESEKRIFDLKPYVILRYSEDIDFNNEAELYDSLISHLAKGDLDDSIYSSHLEDVSKEEKKIIMDLVHEYSSLCFKKGNPDYWTDSVFDIPILDYEYICTRILDNYNFLIMIAKSGGREALDLISSFFGVDEYSNSSIIDFLRNAFIDDKVLEKVIIDMSNKDSLYNIFTKRELALLCTSPDGVLYFYNDNSIDFSSPILIAKEIYKRETGEDSNNFREIITHFRNDEDFEDTLTDIQIDVLADDNKYKNVFVEKYISKNKKM